VVLTGGRTRDDLLKAFAVARKIIDPHCTTENFSHKVLQTRKNASKKIKVTEEVHSDPEVDVADLLGDLTGLE
jgi:hypothetical protein